MNPDQQELTLEQSLKQVMQTLPPFIRDYLAQGKYTPVAQKLMSKYQLRIDQGAVLERELMLLLMGIENPAEFTQALIEDGKIVDQMTVKGIVQDINEQVFIPLRKEEENLSKGIVPPAQKPIAPPVGAARPTPVVPPVRPIAPPAPHVAPLPPKMAMPGASGSLGDILRSIGIPKPTDSSKLLADHEEPHINIATSQSQPVVAPSPSPTPAPAEPVQPLVAAQPAMPERETAVPMPVQMVTPPATPRPKMPPPPPITSYSTDPYREPIDEK